MMTYYAVTIKKTTTKELATIEDYEGWISNAIDKGCEFMQVAYELDKSNKLHCHAVMRGPKNLYKKRLMYKQYHQHIDEIESHEDLIRWVMYIEKCDQRAVEQEAIKQQIQSEYPFITV